jgi:hypothetical protein
MRRVEAEDWKAFDEDEIVARGSLLPEDPDARIVDRRARDGNADASNESDGADDDSEGEGAAEDE